MIYLAIAALVLVGLLLLISFSNSKILEPSEEERALAAKQTTEAERRAAEEKRAAEESKRQKVQVVKDRGGLLEKELDRSAHVSDLKLEVLYLAAIKQNVNFDLVTEKKEQVVPYPTNKIDYTQISDASQIPSVSLDQMVLDDDVFYQKFATRDLMHPEYWDVTDKLKRLYILLDISPSMFDRAADGHMRETLARGLVASLLVDAINGNAEYLLRQFSSLVHDLRSALNPREAEILLAWIADHSEQSSGTNIGNAINKAVDDIESRQKNNLRMNHILLITDGDDNAGLTREAIIKTLGPNIKLHVVLIGTSWGADHPLTPYVIAKY